MTARSQGVADEDERRRLLPATCTTTAMTATKTSHSAEKWRRVVGLLLLFTTVVLWTASNFMASVCFLPL